MTLRVFFTGTVVAMAASWGLFALVVNWVDPAEGGVVGYTLFFLTLFLGIASTTALIGYGVRRIVQPGTLPAYRVRPALRQGILLGLFTNVLLFLQLQRLLRWWVSVIIIVLFISIELLFISYDRVGNNRKTTTTSNKRA